MRNYSDTEKQADRLLMILVLSGLTSAISCLLLV